MPDTSTTPEIRRAENNIFLDGEKVAIITSTGKLQTLPGKKEHRPTIEAFLNEVPLSPSPPAETPSPTLPVSRSSSKIPPCPPMDPMAGDKTPEVIEWYKKYKPEEFSTRYKNRNFTIEA